MLGVICCGQTSLNLTWALNISQAGKREFKERYFLHFLQASKQVESLATPVTVKQLLHIIHYSPKMDFFVHNQG